MLIMLDVHGSKLCEQSKEVKSFSDSQECKDTGAALKAGQKVFNDAVDGGYRVEVACRKAYIVDVQGVEELVYGETLFELKAYQKGSV